MQTKTRTGLWFIALFCLGSAFVNIAYSQSCVDDDGDGWGWNAETNSSCQVGNNGNTGNTISGGLKVSWAASDASENVSEYELIADINSGDPTTLFRGNATTFSIRLADISANYKDFVCVRIRAIRSATSSTDNETYSNWSVPNCITLPDAPLKAPQMIELSLIE